MPGAHLIIPAMQLRVGQHLWCGDRVMKIEHTIEHGLVVTFRRESGATFTQTWTRRTPVRVQKP